MKFPFVRSLLATLLLAAGVAHAADDEAKVKKNLESFLNAPAVDSVKKTPYGGLFEVVLKSGELLYTDGNVSFIIDGNIIDAKTRKNVTQARMAQLMKIDFATLPLDQAIKQVRGNGKRVIASFEDPTAATASASPKTCKASRTPRFTPSCTPS
jgi:thiol:disulfide interchange protein DsbC